KRMKLSSWAPTVLLAVIVVAVWQAVVTFYALPPILLPSPLAVLDAAWETRAELARGAVVTGGAAVAGFLLSIAVGTVVAALMSQSRMLRLALYPYVILLQTVPIVAIAPLLV